MKLLVFAHVPPPHHGQSYMVKLMLDGFGGDCRKRKPSNKQSVECYHVNSRYSEDLEDIGLFQWQKVLLVFFYCFEAIWCRFRYGIEVFYYVPAPGKRAALYRDWIVMVLCRPFFKRFVHHWHAVGLGDWLKREGTYLEHWITHQLLGRPDLGVALAIPSMRDALWFRSKKVEVVPNGIPDPCPEFKSEVLPYRQARFSARRCLLAGRKLTEAERQTAGGDPEIFRVLYLAHCTKTKGVFDALSGVALANQMLTEQGASVRLHLTVAGGFLNEAEQHSFNECIKEKNLKSAVTYAGFVSGETKSSLLRSHDALCFPTFYDAESFGLVVVEGMSVGQAIVTTRWRAVPEMLPPDYPGLIEPQAPQQVAKALLAAMDRDDAQLLREHFIEHFSVQRHLESLAAALVRTGLLG